MVQFRSRRMIAASAVAALVLTTGMVAVSATAAPFLRSTNVTGFPGSLANQGSRSLYVLSAEAGTKVHCKSACLKIWPPLLVKSAVRSVTLGAGVKGKIGFVTRSSTMKQVTFNTYPVYIYSGDSASLQSNGEGVVADGGTWWMINASATTAATTTVKPTLRSRNITYYPKILTNTPGRSLYVLSTEVGASLQCTGACLSVWIPVLVPSATTPITFTSGVNGTISVVSRGTAGYQVMYNSYPVYTYIGDTGPGQWTGEGVVAYGGTWYLASAPSTTPAATPVPPYTY